MPLKNRFLADFYLVARAEVTRAEVGLQDLAAAQCSANETSQSERGPAVLLFGRCVCVRFVTYNRQQDPPRGAHDVRETRLQRYYGHYASPVRGMRRKAAERNEIFDELQLVTLQPEPEALREAKRRRAELLRRILEVEPLRCPRCGETTMRIVAFAAEPKTIDKIPDHLRRTQASRRRQGAPPRRWTALIPPCITSEGWTETPSM